MFKGIATLFVTLAVLSCQAVVVTGNFVIVRGKSVGVPARQSATVLADHWQRLFGVEARIVSEEDFKGKEQAIFLKQCEVLQPDEWRIRSDGKNLYICGGKMRGLFFGACEFLERFGGCRWFTRNTNFVPRRTGIRVPEGQVFQGKPAFPLSRTNGDGKIGLPRAHFLALNKLDGFYDTHWEPCEFNVRSLGDQHSYHLLTKDLPEDSPMLPINAKGQRIRGTKEVGPGQICFANKDFRVYVKKLLAERIQERKKFIAEHGLTDGNWLRWIELSQNDNREFCQCEGCRKLAERYGGISGAQLDFVNDIASAFPEYTFQTFAYSVTSTPPKNIKARDNVIVRFAFLITEPREYVDVMRPLSHPANAQVRSTFEAWRDICSKKSVWCYHRFYGETDSFPWPFCSYWYIPEDFRFYHRYGAVAMIDESEKYSVGFLDKRAFDDLHLYLSAKMMDNPYQDEKRLIDDFFAIQFGAAAPVMKEYADYLKKRLDALPGRACGVPVRKRQCFDEEFFSTVNDLLDRAEGIVAGRDERALKFVRLERLPVDHAAINMWHRFGHLYPSREFLLKRLEATIRLDISHYLLKPGEKLEDNQLFKNEMLRLKMYAKPYYSWKELCTRMETAIRQAVADYLQKPDGKFNDNSKFSNELARLKSYAAPLAKGLGNDSQTVYSSSAIMLNPMYRTMEPEAIHGMAAKVGNLPKHMFNHGKVPMMFGIYNKPSKTSRLHYEIPFSAVPQDEEYHLYHLGRIQPQAGDFLWGHRSWRLSIDRMLQRIYESLDFQKSYDLYVSCKMTGPAYVKGSTKENACYADLLMAVPAPADTEKDKKH